MYTHTHTTGGSESGVSGKGSSLALQPGDVVEVVEGDLMNLQGKVISVELDTVTIMPKHEDLKVRSGWRVVMNTHTLTVVAWSVPAYCVCVTEATA